MSGPVSGLGGPRALPAPAGDDPLVAVIRDLLPERSAEDKAHGEIPLSFGVADDVATLRIPVLFTRANRAWQDQFKSGAKALFEQIEADTSGEVVIGLLSGATDFQLDMLAAYNPAQLNRDWVEQHATDEQILAAFLGVTAAAYPFVVQVARTLLANPDVGRWLRLQLVRTIYSASLSSSPPSTAGSPATSKKS